MSAETIRDLFAYNRWANGLILENLAALPEEDYLLDRRSSHGGIHGTLVHLVFAQHVWLLRWRLEETAPAYAASKLAKSLADVSRTWKTIDSETTSFLDGHLDDGFLRSTFQMKTPDGISFVHDYDGSMRHLVNHSSYHRGQIVTMVRQAGHKPVTTDLIRYLREKR